MKETTLPTPGGRVIFIQTPQRLSPQKLIQALGSMSDDDPQWIAVHQLLDEELARATLEASEAKIPADERAHACGGIEALACLKARLYDERAKPAASEQGRVS